MQNIMSPQNEFLKRNERLWMRPGRVYIPASNFSGIAYDPTVVIQLRSVGTGIAATGNLELVEVNTSGVTGINFTTAANSINHLMEVPADLDLSFPIYTSVYWTANNVAGSTDWRILYKPFIANSTVLGSAEAATATDKLGAAHTMAGVAFTLMRTPEMRIDGGRLPDTTELLQLKVQMNALVTIATTFFIGLEVRYTRKFLQYGSMKAEAKAATFIASEKYAN